jgi:hypothetical protein
MMGIHEKLMNIQSKLKAPKNQYNSFGKYNYRSCEDILEGVKPLLKETQTVLTISDEVINIGDRFYIKATATLTDTEDGRSISVSALAREDENKKGMDLSQVTGSTSSYARKYALNGLFCIDDTKDSDATNKHGKEQSDKLKSNQGQLTDAQLKRLYAIAYSVNIDADTVKQHVRKKFNKEVKDLTKEEYDQVCKGYESLKNK